MDSVSSPPRRYVSRYPGTWAPKYPGGHAKPKILPGREQRVLIIDDDPFFRSLLKVMLEQAGWANEGIRDAEDSVTAFEICASRPVDLVFCDLHLLRFKSDSGLEVVRELRSTHPLMPIIMVTADNDESLIKEMLAAGATGFLLKPISLRSLKNVFTC
jgi:CheY-like chemotaxis protein